MIHQWKHDGGNVIDWLAEHGHDSPLAQCDVFVDSDRTIRVGDKVVLYRRADGKLGKAEHIYSWDDIPSYAKQGCAAGCWVAATVLQVSVDGLFVSSYGAKFAIVADKDSPTLYFDDANLVWFDFHDHRYTGEIDPKVAKQTAVISVPCWRDREAISTFRYATQTQQQVHR